jgi:hypothetical protein
MPQRFWMDACSIASIWPFRLATSALVAPSPLMKNRAGQKTTTPTVVATASPVALLSWAPAAWTALVETRLASSRS